MKRIWVLLLAATAALPAADLAAPRLNVVFILADDLKPDILPPFGGREIETPNLDRLAARGCVFLKATCGYPICWVARSELIAGRCFVGANMTPDTMGEPPLLPQWVLWPQLMRRSGWHTIESGKWNVRGTPWHDGFDETDGLFHAGGGLGPGRATIMVTPTGRKVTGYTGWTLKADQNYEADPNAREEAQPQFGTGKMPDTDNRIVERALAAIRRMGARPFFAQINLTETHDPLHWPPGMENAFNWRNLQIPPNFMPGPGFDTGNRYSRDESIVPEPRSGEDVRKERAIYFAEAENVDRLLGKIVATLTEMGVMDRTLILFSSDQGLAMGSHGLMGKQNEYEHTINVPMMVAGPGIPAGRRISGQCYQRDLYPTVCALTGLPIPASVQGKNLLPLIRGEAAEIYPAIFGYFTATQRMIRRPDGWKLIWYPQIGKYQLFDVADDPYELHDRSDEPGMARTMLSLKRDLTAWQESAGDPLLHTKVFVDNPAFHE